MPSYQATMPDGATYQLDAENEDALGPAIEHLQKMHPAPPVNDPSEGAPGRNLQIGPLDTGIPTPQWLDRTLAGAGETFSNIASGVKQRVTEAASLVSPLGPEIAQQRAAEAQRRERDAPLNATMAGKVGQIGAGALAMAPALAIPGANTAVGASVLGALYGAAQPTVSGKETAINTGLGAVTSAAGQYAGGKIAQYAANKLASRSAAAAAQEARNAPRDATLAASREAGYVVPPTDVNPSGTATALESLSGKAATRQGARVTNAQVTDNLVGSDLGLAPGVAPTKAAIAQARTNAGGIYKAIKGAGPYASDSGYLDDLIAVGQGGSNLERTYPGIGTQASQKVQDLIKSVTVDSHDGPEAVDLTRFLRNEAHTNFKSAFASGGDPEKLALARAQSQVADAVEDLIGRNLARSGQAELATQWQAARTLIAKSYQADAALQGGHFNALKLAAQMNRNKPISGGMRTAAEFADQFGEAAKLPRGGVGVSKLGAGVALGGLVTGHPWLAALPVMSAAARHGLLSRAGQSLLANPSYAPGMVGTGALKTLGTTGRLGGLLSPAGALAQSPP